MYNINGTGCGICYRVSLWKVRFLCWLGKYSVRIMSFYLILCNIIVKVFEALILVLVRIITFFSDHDRQLRAAGVADYQINNFLHANGDVEDEDDIYSVMPPDEEEDLARRFPHHCIKENWFFPDFERFAVYYCWVEIRVIP